METPFGTLICVYAAMAISGLIYALGLLILGDLGGGADGVDVDASGGLDVDGDGGLSIFSPVSIATFITTFGATGLVCVVGLEMDDRISMLVAFVVAAVASLLVAFIYGRVLVEMHGTTEIRQADMIGMLCQVTTPIPASGLGEVIYEISNERGNKPARSANGAAIPRGTTVVVEEIVGGVLIVRARQPVG